MKIYEEMLGKYVIVRGDRSGVFAGELSEVDGTTVELKNCRRLWYWSGANSLSQLAVEGTKNPNACKFTVVVEQLIILDAIEIIPTSGIAENIIKGVVEWRLN